MQSDGVVIRAMTQADIEGVRALAAEIWHEHYTDIIGTAQIQYMLEQRYRSELLNQELSTPGIWWDVLCVDRALRGYSSYLIEDEARVLKLDKLYVHASCRGRGCGERMLERVMRTAAERGCAKVVLAVNKRNVRSIDAYRKWGFEIEQAVVKDIGGGFRMDDYIMARSA
jgi:ribosomal protein S18 acetylase RimI-like enzyme